MLFYRDIRIGNLFLYKPDLYYCVLQKKSDLLTIGGFQKKTQCHISDLEPIPISTDILSVCGFRPTSTVYTKTVNTDLVLTFRFNHDGIHELYHTPANIIHVSYVHDLQNAYFDISGDDLNPNLIGVKES